jgi:hypothetical protein
MSGISFNNALGYTSMLAGKLSTAAGIGSAASILNGAHKSDPVDTGSGLTAVSESEVKSSSAADQFLEYMQMSDEEKLKYALLAQMGISKEDYDAMSPDKKAEIDKKIAERMEQIAKAQTQAPSSAQSVEAKLQAFATSAYANEKKTPLVNFEV